MFHKRGLPICKRNQMNIAEIRAVMFSLIASRLRCHDTMRKGNPYAHTC